MAKRRRNYSLPHLLNERETRGDLVARQLEREKHVTIELVERLGLFKELVGHEGCVNCLDWNKPGTILASGSDDQSVILWNGFTGKLKTQLNTEHQGNIFSVKFLPETGDSLIVTGGQDARVCLLDVEKKVCIRSAALHIGRVKRLAVSPDTSGIFWSSAEDGTVMQWDTREKWREGGNNVLINLVKHVGKAEIKSIAVNPTKPELIAIGANDPYVRVYDRRRLSLQKLTEESGETVRNWERRTQLAVSGGAGDNTPHDAVQYFTPKHLPDQQAKYKSTLRTLSSTYLSYSTAGTELLVNTGGEHVYLYQKFRLFEKNPPPSLLKQISVIQGCAETTSQPSAESVLPKDVETLKLSANSEFESGNHYRAIELYNLAISRFANHVLYANRAAALLKRAFRGDVYAALRDCLSALNLNPRYVKAHLRLGRCLTDLGWLEEADLCLSNFKTNFPEHRKSKSFVQLLNDFQSAQDEKVPKDKVSPVPDQEEEREASVPYTREDFLRSVDGERDREEEEMEVDEKRFIPPRLKISSQEIKWRRLARDYSSRFVGAANIQTDIKEASFFGSDCQFVVAGSDDGRILIWDTRTSNLVKVLAGDNITVNCVQGHPGAPVLASSGIEAIIRLWHPLPENSTKESRNIQEMEKVVRENQNRMALDPFEFFMRTAEIRGEDEMQCRTS